MQVITQTIMSGRIPCGDHSENEVAPFGRPSARRFMVMVGGGGAK